MTRPFTVLNVSIVPSSYEPNSMTTTALPSVHTSPEQEIQSYRYSLLLVAIMAVLLVAFTLVILLIRKRRFDQYRHHLIPLYDLDDQDWHVELPHEKNYCKPLEFPAHATTRFSP
ncbi:uncharacterized protein LOC117653798 [Thrips palmi]|uniref:Uncharacterized protein LOC117653798 n=1 Tax=Thrips palmi TaxID=161013 RepID=A0A6P9AE03_THRPL|nr:uncharacterized protein LOC117653798 [Thrips palmi]